MAQGIIAIVGGSLVLALMVATTIKHPVYDDSPPIVTIEGSGSDTTVPVGRGYVSLTWEAPCSITIADHVWTNGANAGERVIGSGTTGRVALEPVPHERYFYVEGACDWTLRVSRT